MPSVRIVLVAGLILIAGGLVVTLSGSPASVARASSTQEEDLGSNAQGLAACQAGELLPRGTTAIRLKLSAYTGPRVSVEAYAGSRVLARGERGAGWTGGSVTVVLRRAVARSARVRLCFGWTLKGMESVTLLGERTAPAVALHLDDGSAAIGRVGVEYLRPGQSSWLSMLSRIARRLGLGREPAGTWVAVLVAMLMIGVVALCSRTLIRELR
jgi:hypothetical protein